MKVIDLINSSKSTAFSFEILPPLKGNSIHKELFLLTLDAHLMLSNMYCLNHIISYISCLCYFDISKYFGGNIP